MNDAPASASAAAVAAVGTPLVVPTLVSIMGAKTVRFGFNSFVEPEPVPVPMNDDSTPKVPSPVAAVAVSEPAAAAAAAAPAAEDSEAEIRREITTNIPLSKYESLKARGFSIGMIHSYSLWQTFRIKLPHQDIDMVALVATGRGMSWNDFLHHTGPMKQLYQLCHKPESSPTDIIRQCQRCIKIRICAEVRHFESGMWTCMHSKYKQLRAGPLSVAEAVAVADAPTKRDCAERKRQAVGSKRKSTSTKNDDSKSTDEEPPAKRGKAEVSAPKAPAETVESLVRQTTGFDNDALVSLIAGLAAPIKCEFNLCRGMPDNDVPVKCSKCCFYQLCKRCVFIHQRSEDCRSKAKLWGPKNTPDQIAAREAASAKRKLAREKAKEAKAKSDDLAVKQALKALKAAEKKAAAAAAAADDGTATDDEEMTTSSEDADATADAPVL